RILDLRVRRAPCTLWRELNLVRREVAHSSVRRPMTATRPQHTAGRLAHAKGHQRAAVVEVDAGPIPTDGFGGQVLARPLVITPADAGDPGVPARSRDLAGRRELRLAGVTACRTLAGDRARVRR